MRTASRDKFDFYKMHSGGNDFVVILDQPSIKLSGRDIINFCDRRNGVGADGLIYLDESNLDVSVMRFFNSDGSEAAMCGNGFACLSRLLSLVNGSNEIRVKTQAGLFNSLVNGDSVNIIFDAVEGPYECARIDAVFGEREFFLVNTSVWHLVVMVQNIDEVDILRRGHELAHHSTFDDIGGVNVQFIQWQTDSNVARLSTYEKGVEGITYSCGSGAIAAAHCILNKSDCDEITFSTIGGGIRVAKSNKSYTLNVRVELVYGGVLF